MAIATDTYAAEQKAVEQLTASRARIQTELGKVIVGQREVIEQILIALFAGGHCLITGAPGLAKTLLVKSIAQIFHLKFQRIQFTPDLMPADITGTEILQESGGRRARHACSCKGPIFAQHDPGRRNQPHAAQDAGRAARSDAGTSGDRRRRALSAAPSRSSCSPRRTRSRWKAPIRCPRRSSIVSCSTW